MKNKKLFVFILLLIFAVFTTCDNPVINKWWVEEEPDYDYVALIKDIPYLIYETIIEEQIIEKIVREEIIITVEMPQIIVEYVEVEKPVPPEILMQYIDIIGIEFVLFSGDATEYNGLHGAHGSTDLTPQEQRTNNEIVLDMVKELNDHPEYFLILHGHANPVLNTRSETDELIQISTARAASVRDAVAAVYTNGDGELPGIYDPPSTLPPSHNIPVMPSPHPLEKRMTTKGYGGERNMAGPSSSYAALNRRVEAILFTIRSERQQAEAPVPPAPGTPLNY